MAQHADILIIGGVIGLSAAWFLSREGASVLLVEQGDVGRQASWAGAGNSPRCASTDHLYTERRLDREEGSMDDEVESTLSRRRPEEVKRMSPATEQILQAALSLPAEERLELIDALLAFQEEDRPLDEAWMKEVRRRSAELDAGSVTPIPWSEVKKQLRRGEQPRG
jgi:putative addiction module component (TIGR02574 family)